MLYCGMFATSNLALPEMASLSWRYAQPSTGICGSYRLGTCWSQVFSFGLLSFFDHKFAPTPHTWCVTLISEFADLGKLWHTSSSLGLVGSDDSCLHGIKGLYLIQLAYLWFLYISFAFLCCNAWRRAWEEYFMITCCNLFLECRTLQFMAEILVWLSWCFQFVRGRMWHVTNLWSKKDSSLVTRPIWGSEVRKPRQRAW